MATDPVEEGIVYSAGSREKVINFSRQWGRAMASEEDVASIVESVRRQANNPRLQFTNEQLDSLRVMISEATKKVPFDLPTGVSSIESGYHYPGGSTRGIVRTNPMVSITQTKMMRMLRVQLAVTELANSSTYLSDEAKTAKQKTVKQVKEVKALVLGPKRSRWCK